MAITFDNAPLIEVIAEIRWGAATPFPPQVMLNQQPQHFAFNLEASQSEEFFMNFGAECGSRGLQRAERIIPPGFPVIPGQVVYRFRSNDRSQQNLLQVGQGVFTANAVAPYQSWESFNEFMEKGLDALISARPGHEAATDFLSVSLRFVNGFGEDYFENSTKIDFLKSLGFQVQVPTALSEITKESNDAFFNVNYSSSLGDGSKVQVNIIEGLKDGSPIQIIELGCTHSNIAPVKDQLMQVLNSSHDVIEKIFLNMTENVADKMKPRRV